jgi:hypothetical protein
MKKYLVLAILPILASCTSKPASTKLAEFPERPTQDASRDGVMYSNKGLAYPHRVVDQTAVSSLDITEDSADFVSGVSTRQVRNYANTTTRTTRRGSHIVRKEGTRFAEVVYDTGDNVADVAHDETIEYGQFVGRGVERTMHTGGTLVCGALTTYSNAVDSGTRGIFGGLLRCAVRDTKPYMVGSLNDAYPAGEFPGSSWRGRKPQMPVYEPIAETSAKSVYTASK